MQECWQRARSRSWATHFVTANDTDDPDVGANALQNFLDLTSAPVSDGHAAVSGTLNSTPNTTFRLELFTNAACNAAAPNDYGEGQTYIGTANVTTDGNGDASFGPLSFPVPDGRSVITATDPDGNTSEVSRCFVRAVQTGEIRLTVSDAFLIENTRGYPSNSG